MFCNVSIVLSDSDSRDLLNGSAFTARSCRGSSSCMPSSASISGKTSSCSQRTGPKGFLNSDLSLGCLIRRLGGGTVAWRRISRSRGFGRGAARGDGFVVELDNCSRDRALRKRGLFIFSLEGCWRFSLEAAGRNPARGTGSLETRRGSPLCLALVD